jgi:hypothetical protein
MICGHIKDKENLKKRSELISSDLFFVLLVRNKIWKT